MTTSVTRPCFTTQHQTCKTKTKTTMYKTKTDFLVSDRSCAKTDGLRPHHCLTEQKIVRTEVYLWKCETDGAVKVRCVDLFYLFYFSRERFCVHISQLVSHLLHCIGRVGYQPHCLPTTTTHSTHLTADVFICLWNSKQRLNGSVLSAVRRSDSPSVHIDVQCCDTTTLQLLVSS